MQPRSRQLPFKEPTTMKQAALKITATTLLVASLAACGTTMTAPTATLPGKEVGVSTAGKQELDAASLAGLHIDREHTVLGEIRWAAPQTAAISTQEQSALLKLLREELQARLTQLPISNSGRRVVLRAAITRVEPVSPVLNVVSSLLLIAPWDRGGAATEIEVVDAETGKPLVSQTSGYYPPMSEFKARFIKLAPAEIALKKAVADFMQRLSATSPAPAEGSGTTALHGAV